MTEQVNEKGLHVHGVLESLSPIPNAELTFIRLIVHVGLQQELRWYRIEGGRRGWLDDPVIWGEALSFSFDRRSWTRGDL